MPKKKFMINRAIQAMDCYDPVSIFLDSIGLYKSKKLILEVLAKLKYEICESKIKRFFVELLKFAKNDLELLYKIDETVIILILRNIEIKLSFLQDVIDLFEYTKQKVHYKIEQAEYEFWSQNFYNYHLYKFCTENFDFDVCFSEKIINQDNEQMFTQLLSKIAENNYDNEKFCKYIANFKNNDIVKRFVKEMHQNFQYCKFIEIVELLKIKNSLFEDLVLAQKDDSLQNFMDENIILEITIDKINSKYVLDLYKNSLCNRNMDDNICTVCENNNTIQCSFSFEQIDTLLEENIFLLNDTNDIYFALKHNKNLLTLKTLENVIKATYKSANNQIFQLYSLFDFDADNGFNLLFIDFLDFMTSKCDEGSIEKDRITMFHIFRNLKSLDKTFTHIFMFLYNVYYSTKNKYLKYQIQLYLKDKMKFVYRSDAGIYDFIFAQDTERENLATLLQSTIELFDIQYDDFVLNALNAIALYTFNNNMFDLIESHNELMARSFVIFDLIINCKLSNEYYFDIHISGLKKKLATKLLTLAMFYGIELQIINDFLQLPSIEEFTHKNFVPLILTVKDFFLFYKLDYVCCIYEVLCKLLKLILSDNNCFNVKASSYIMYFVSEKTKKVEEWCKSLGHDSNICQNLLFQMLSNSTCKEKANTKQGTNNSQIINNTDFVDQWYIESMKFLLHNDKMYYFTINKIVIELDNLLQKMSNDLTICADASLKNTDLKNDNFFLYMVENNTYNFKNKFYVFYDRFYQKYSRYKEAYDFIGRTGVLKITRYIKIERNDFMMDGNIHMPRILGSCLEHIYKSFDLENQETYYYVMQQIIFGIPDNKILTSIDNDFIQQLRSSAYFYNGDFSSDANNDLNFSNTHSVFINDLFYYVLSHLKEHFLDYYEYFKYGMLLDHRIQSFMLYHMLYILSNSKIDVNMTTKLDIKNLHNINKRSLKYILRLNAFCQNSIIDQYNSILIALYMKDYYYMIKTYENMHKNGKRSENILCALYMLISDYEKCSVLNAQTKLISAHNVFFDLCLEKEFINARKCLKNIYCDEIESQLYNLMLEKIESEEFDFEEIYKTSNDLTKQYNTWNLIDTEKKNTNLYIAYNIKLITNNPFDEKVYELLIKRHTILAFEHQSIINNLNFTKNLLQETSGMKNSLVYKKYQDYLVFKEISKLRETNNLILCKSKITTLLLEKEYDVMYEYARYKLHEGKNKEAAQILEKYLYMSTSCNEIDKKATLLHATLRQDINVFTDALEKYKLSEHLYFQYAKFLENVDPLASLEAYLKSLAYGTKNIHESFLKILDLLCEVRNDKHLKKSYKTMAEYYKKASALLEIHISDVHVNNYKHFISQILSKLGHPNKKVNDVIALLIKSIVIADDFSVSGWYIMFTFDKDSKEFHTEMINILKSLPSEMHIKLKEFKALVDTLINISKYDAKGKKSIDIDETLKYNRDINIKIRVPSECWETYIEEIENDIYVYHSLQCPKRISFLGSNGKKYYFLCKSNDDLRKDVRFMDLSRIMNFILSNNNSVKDDNLYIRTYNIFVLKYSCGIIEWVSGLETLRNIIYPEYAKLGLIVNDELKKHRTKKKVGDKQFPEVLKRFPPVLYNYFDSITDYKTSYLARERFTKTYAVMCVVGWFMGLGDRHLENILIDTATSDTFHVDLNCILNKARKLEIPESVPFRLTQNIVDAFGVLKTEATFKSTMIKTLKIMIQNEELIMTTLQCILNDPFAEWKSKSNTSIETIKKVLDEFRAKLKCDPEKMVDSLIFEATDLHNLANMYIGWCSFV